VTAGPVTRETVVVATERQVSAQLDGEAVVLSLRDGIYYGLDAVGARVWELVQESRTVGAIRDAVVAQYDVDADRCEQDVIRLVTELREMGLVEIDR
jgi:hypothetical protein